MLINSVLYKKRGITLSTVPLKLNFFHKNRLFQMIKSQCDVIEIHVLIYFWFTFNPLRWVTFYPIHSGFSCILNQYIQKINIIDYFILLPFYSMLLSGIVKLLFLLNFINLIDLDLICLTNRALLLTFLIYLKSQSKCMSKILKDSTLMYVMQIHSRFTRTPFYTHVYSPLLRNLMGLDI